MSSSLSLPHVFSLVGWWWDMIAKPHLAVSFARSAPAQSLLSLRSRSQFSLSVPSFLFPIWLFSDTSPSLRNKIHVSFPQLLPHHFSPNQSQPHHHISFQPTLTTALHLVQPTSTIPSHLFQPKHHTLNIISLPNLPHNHFFANPLSSPKSHSYLKRQSQKGRKNASPNQTSSGATPHAAFSLSSRVGRARRGRGRPPLPERRGDGLCRPSRQPKVLAPRETNARGCPKSHPFCENGRVQLFRRCPGRPISGAGHQWLPVHSARPPNALSWASLHPPTVRRPHLSSKMLVTFLTT